MRDDCDLPVPRIAFVSVGLRDTTLIAACLGFAACAVAQPYPNKPVTLIVPVNAGGPADILARTAAPQLSKILGQPVIVENRPGASWKIGTHALLRAPRDGYTLSVVSSAVLTLNPLIDRAIGYDPLRDFTLLTHATDGSDVLVIHPSVPAKSLQELVAYARANPGKLSYGSGGSGTSIHFSTQGLLLKLGIIATHVPYKGDAPALNDLLSGHIQMMLPYAGVAAPFVRAGKLVALATSGSKRSAMLPDVPAYNETGIAKLKDYSNTRWLGFAAAAGIPPEASRKLQEALVGALRQPEVKQKFAAEGIDVVASTAEEFTAFIRAELEGKRKVIESGAIKFE